MREARPDNRGFTSVLFCNPKKTKTFKMFCHYDVLSDYSRKKIQQSTSNARTTQDLFSLEITILCYFSTKPVIISTKIYHPFQVKKKNKSMGFESRMQSTKDQQLIPLKTLEKLKTKHYSAKVQKDHLLMKIKFTHTKHNI